MQSVKKPEGEPLVDALIRAVQSDQYSSSSKAVSPTSGGISDDAVAVYRTMFSAFAHWSFSEGIDPSRDPALSIRSFVAAKEGSWSDQTRQRYIRLLTRAFQALNGGSLIVVKRPDPKQDDELEGESFGEINDIAQTREWITRDEVEGLIAPALSRLPLKVTEAIAERQGSCGSPGLFPVTQVSDWKLARNAVILSAGLDLGVRLREIQKIRQSSLVKGDTPRMIVHQDETAPTARGRRLSLGAGPDMEPSDRARLRAQVLLGWWQASMPQKLSHPGWPLFPSTASGGELTSSTVFKALQALGVLTGQPGHWLFNGGVQALRRAHIQMALSEGVAPADLAKNLGVWRKDSIERYLI